MNIDAGRFREIMRTLHAGPLAVADAESIMAIAQLAIDADGHEDSDEITMFFTIGKAIYEHAGIADTPTPTFAADEEDAERLVTLAKGFTTTMSRELAFGVAHLLTGADIAVAAEEDVFLENLRVALTIDEGRAGALASTMNAAIAP